MTTTVGHFWTLNQHIYYANVLYNQDRIFHHKYMDCVEMEQLPCFEPVLELLHMTGLLDFALFRQDCNEELIFQFYATLFIFGDMKDMRTRKLQWMTQHTVYEAST